MNTDGRAQQRGNDDHTACTVSVEGGRAQDERFEVAKQPEDVVVGACAALACVQRESDEAAQQFNRGGGVFGGQSIKEVNGELDGIRGHEKWVHSRWFIGKFERADDRVMEDAGGYKALFFKTFDFGHYISCDGYKDNRYAVRAFGTLVFQLLLGSVAAGFGLYRSNP